MQKKKNNIYPKALQHTWASENSLSWNMGHYLWVADELPVKLCIKGLHLQTVHIQHWIPNDADLWDKERIINRMRFCDVLSLDIPSFPV